MYFVNAGQNLSIVLETKTNNGIDWKTNGSTIINNTRVMTFPKRFSLQEMAKENIWQTKSYFFCLLSFIRFPIMIA